MARRLAALALTFVFVLVPVATELCEASCARHDATSAMPGGHRCCHGAPGHAPAVHAVAVLCDHPADAPAGISSPQLVAGIPVPPTFVSPSVPILHAVPVRARLAPSTPLGTTTPLRI